MRVRSCEVSFLKIAKFTNNILLKLGIASIFKQNVAYKVCSWGKGKPSKKSKKTPKEREGHANEHSKCCNRKMFYQLEFKGIDGMGSGHYLVCHKHL